MPTHPSAFNLLWQPKMLLAIVCIGELIAAILSLTPGNHFDRWVFFGLSSLTIQWITILTLTTIYFLSPFLSGKSIHLIAWSCLGIFVVNTFIFSLISWYLLHLSSLLQGQSMGEFAGQMTLIAFLIGLLSLAAFQNHWHARLNAIKSKQAQLDALHARIKPHFLFNTLNSLTVLIKKNPDQAEHLLFNLVDLLRVALSDAPEVNLINEIKVTKQYLEIEKIRFGDRLNVQWQLPEIIPDIQMPSLSLQPLVENAIKYGVSQIEKGDDISISVQSMDNQVIIQIRNTYIQAINNEQTSGHKIGVMSTKTRISLMSEGQNTLNTYVQDNQFIAEICIKKSV